MVGRSCLHPSQRTTEQSSLVPSYMSTALLPFLLHIKDPQTLWSQKPYLSSGPAAVPPCLCSLGALIVKEVEVTLSSCYLACLVLT